MKFGVLALTASLALGLTACGGGGSSPRSTATVTETATATATVTVTSEPAPAPSPSKQPAAPNTGANALEVGQWREGADVRSRVVEFKQPSAVTPPSYLRGDSDAEGALMRLQVCTRPSSPKAYPVSAYDFYMYTKAGGEYTVGGATWQSWPPLPQFSYETKVAPGRCATGWVLFPMPKTTRIAYVSYGSGANAVAEWNTPS